EFRVGVVVEREVDERRTGGFGGLSHRGEVGGLVEPDRLTGMAEKRGFTGTAVREHFGYFLRRGWGLGRNRAGGGTQSDGHAGPEPARVDAGGGVDLAARRPFPGVAVVG